jgi:large subunit ribosomal protein L25
MAAADTTLEAVKRNTFGDGEAGRMRRAGKIPAVLYGGESKEGTAVAVDPKVLSRILHSKSGANTLISLKLEGGADTKVLVKEYQLEPISHRLIHADFYRVAMDKVLKVTVPIHLTGVAKGIKNEGGIVDFVHRELNIECLPADIPEQIVVDVTDLGLNQGIRVRDLVATGQKWKALSEPEMLIVHVILPKVEEVVAPADAAAVAGAAAEPEVIKKGKIEKEGDEAPAKDAKAEKDTKKK